MSSPKDALAKQLKSITKDFTKAKHRAADRPLSARDWAWLQAEENRQEREFMKKAAWEAMPHAYAQASDNGRLPANARQIMYAARPLVLNATHGKCWKNSEQFTQHYLPDYITEHSDITAQWDVVYDARGHLVEPHVRHKLGLGTLEVRSYINSWNEDVDEDLEIEIDKLYPTRGPANRYNSALFIEKEGFAPLLERAQIAPRNDLAIFSSKGMSTTATRMLVERLSEAGVTILVAHDFDLAGLSICHTLGHDTRRYTFTTEPNVIDIGLRLDDVTTMALQTEPQVYKQIVDPRDRFLYSDFYLDADITREELDFLVEKQTSWKAWQGKRVELNAMTSQQFLDWLENKLHKHGVKKIIPDSDTLTTAYRRAQHIATIQQLINQAQQAQDDTVEVPENLAEQIRELLKTEPTLSWDEALLLLNENKNS